MFSFSLQEYNMTPPTVWLDAYLLSQFAVPSIQAHANTLADVWWAMAACVSTACKLSQTGLFLRVHHAKQAPERRKTRRQKLVSLSHTQDVRCIRYFST